MTSNFSIHLLLLMGFILSLPVFPQEPNDSVSSFIDLPKVLKLTKKEQISFFNRALGKPVNRTSFTTTTKYKNGRQAKVSCEQYDYETKVGKIVCFYFGDTKRLGHFVLQPSDDYKTDKHRVLFFLLNLTPPASLGLEKGFAGMYWHDFLDYHGFTKVQLARNDYFFNGIDVYLDRIE